VGPRHLVPVAFVATLIVGSVLCLIFPEGWWLLGVVAIIYGAAAVAAAIDTARRRRDWRFVVAMPAVFLALHISYGLGSLFGAVRLVAALLRRPGLRRARAE
jgi:hypothetical protein